MPHDAPGVCLLRDREVVRTAVGALLEGRRRQCDRGRGGDRRRRGGVGFRRRSPRLRISTCGFPIESPAAVRTARSQRRRSSRRTPSSRTRPIFLSERGWNGALGGSVRHATRRADRPGVPIGARGTEAVTRRRRLRVAGRPGFRSRRVGRVQSHTDALRPPRIGYRLVARCGGVVSRQGRDSREQRSCGAGVPRSRANRRPATCCVSVDKSARAFPEKRGNQRKPRKNKGIPELENGDRGGWPPFSKHRCLGRGRCATHSADAPSTRVEPKVMDCGALKSGEGGP
jgi:hypothetical protein